MSNFDNRVEKNLCRIRGAQTALRLYSRHKQQRQAKRRLLLAKS